MRVLLITRDTNSMASVLRQFIAKLTLRRPMLYRIAGSNSSKPWAPSPFFAMFSRVSEVLVATISASASTPCATKHSRRQHCSAITSQHKQWRSAYCQIFRVCLMVVLVVATLLATRHENIAQVDGQQRVVGTKCRRDSPNAARAKGVGIQPHLGSKHDE